MEDLLSTPGFGENLFMGSDLPSEIDPITQQISELSKKGYQLLKENDIEGAENIQAKHVAEAIQYRGLDRKYNR